MDISATVTAMEEGKTKPGWVTTVRLLKNKHFNIQIGKGRLKKLTTNINREVGLDGWTRMKETINKSWLFVIDFFFFCLEYDDKGNLIFFFFKKKKIM